MSPVTLGNLRPSPDFKYPIHVKTAGLTWCPLSNPLLLTFTGKDSQQALKAIVIIKRNSWAVVSRSRLPKILEYKNLRSSCPVSFPEPVVLEIKFSRDNLSFFYSSDSTFCAGRQVELCGLTWADHVTLECCWPSLVLSILACEKRELHPVDPKVLSCARDLYFFHLVSLGQCSFEHSEGTD